MSITSASVVGDKYAGERCRADFESHGIRYIVSRWTASEASEGTEPLLNEGRIVLPDVARLEQQLLGLVWRGGRQWAIERRSWLTIQTWRRVRACSNCRCEMPRSGVSGPTLNAV